ncbi:MAG: glycosyltransferase [Planctomycetota bacterium]
MKILHVTHGFYPESGGGSEAYVRDQLVEQRRLGFDVSLLTGSMHPWPECGLEELEIDGARVLRLHRDDFYFDYHAKAWHPSIERILRDVLARERPDLLHLHQWIRLTSNVIEIADELGIPSVLTLHDLYTSCPRAFRVRPGDHACDRPLSVTSCLSCVPRYGHESDEELALGIELHHAQYQSELGRARAILVASPATAEMIGATTGFPSDKFTILPLGYPRRFPGGTVPPAPLPAAAEPFRFGYWGNLTRRKGAHVLVQAFSQLVADHPSRPVELHLFGGIDTEELRRELEAAVAGKPVVLHGRFEYEQVAAARLHLAVFPMVCFETFGFVLDEAFELGLPCIVTDLGAMPRRAGAAAVAVPPNEPTALAQAMARFLENPELRDELAQQLPPPSPEPAAHSARLVEIYEAARSAPGLVAEPVTVDPLRRASLALRQRETALRALHPARGPE